MKKMDRKKSIKIKKISKSLLVFSEVSLLGVSGVLTVFAQQNVAYEGGAKPSIYVNTYNIERKNAVIEISACCFFFTKTFNGDQGKFMKMIKDAATVDGTYNEDKAKEIICGLFKHEKDVDSEGSKLFEISGIGASSADFALTVVNMDFEPDADGKTGFVVQIVSIGEQTNIDLTIKISETDLLQTIYKKTNDVEIGMENISAFIYDHTFALQYPWETQASAFNTKPGNKNFNWNSQNYTTLLPAGTIISNAELTSSMWVVFKRNLKM